MSLVRWNTCFDRDPLARAPAPKLTPRDSVAIEAP